MKSNQIVTLLTLVLSIIGAGAWIPTIAGGVFTLCRKVHGTIIDAAFIYDMKLSRDQVLGPPMQKTGTVLIVAFNFFVYRKALLADDYDVEIRLKNGASFLNPTTCDNNPLIRLKNGKSATYLFPPAYNLNISRLLVAEQDNIRIVPWLLEGLEQKEPLKLDDVAEIRITFHSGRQHKTVRFTQCSQNKFSLPAFIVSFLKEL